MAQQGNYVTVPTGNAPNPYKGLGDALTDLSTLFSKQAVSQEEQRRWDIERARQIKADQRADLTYEDEQASKEWYRDFANIYNPDDIRRKYAKSEYGVTDEQLNSEIGRQILDEIPLYREDVTDFYNTAYTSKFGRPLDAVNIQSVYSSLPSITALQAAEDARAKSDAENKRYLLGKQIDAAKSLMPSTTRSGKSTVIPKRYEDIDVMEMIKDFDENSWFLPWQSEKQDAHEIAHNALATLRKKNVPAQDAKAIIRFTLDNLRNEGDLQGIDYSGKRIDKLLDQGIQNAAAGMYSGYEGNTAAQKYLDKVMSISARDISAMNPSNIRDFRRSKAQERINRLINPVASKPATIDRRVSESTVWPKRLSDVKKTDLPVPTRTPVNVQMTEAQANVLGNLPEDTQREMLYSLTPNKQGKVSSKGTLSRTFLDQAADIQEKQKELKALYTDHRTRWSKEYIAKKKAFREAELTHEKTKDRLRAELDVSKKDVAGIKDMEKRLKTLYSDHRTRWSKEAVELKKALDNAKANYDDRL